MTNIPDEGSSSFSGLFEGGQVESDAMLDQFLAENWEGLDSLRIEDAVETTRGDVPPTPLASSAMLGASSGTLPDLFASDPLSAFGGLNIGDSTPAGVDLAMAPDQKEQDEQEENTQAAPLAETEAPGGLLMHRSALHHKRKIPPASMVPPATPSHEPMISSWTQSIGVKHESVSSGTPPHLVSMASPGVDQNTGSRSPAAFAFSPVGGTADSSSSSPSPHPFSGESASSPLASSFSSSPASSLGFPPAHGSFPSASAATPLHPGATSTSSATPPSSSSFPSKTAAAYEMEMNRAQHLINEVHKLQIQQKNELAKMREYQMQLLGTPTAELVKQLADQQLRKAQKIEEQLKFLQEIRRQLLLEPPELHRLSFLLRDLKMQHTIIELLHNELEQLIRPHGMRKKIAQLYILNEPFPIVITKKKQLVEEALQVVLLTGASVSIESYGTMQCTMLVDAHQVKESPEDMLACDNQPIDTTTHIARFPLKFMCGTRTTAVTARFAMQLKVKTGDGGSAIANVESETSSPFVVITNKSQWQRSAGVVLKKEAFSSQLEITWPQFANALQVHVLKATKQDLVRPTRALTPQDLAYLKSKFLGGRDFISQKDFDVFWSWFGKNLSVLRYQRHVGPMWQNGYIYGFLTRDQVRAALEGREPGTFIMRFSERHAGQFAIAYVGSEEPTRIKHYLVQPNDTAGAKKTLPDFLGECPQFRSLLQCVIHGTASGDPPTLRPIVKDICLAKYYSRRTPPPSGSGYDPL